MREWVKIQFIKTLESKENLQSQKKSRLLIFMGHDGLKQGQDVEKFQICNSH